MDASLKRLEKTYKTYGKAPVIAGFEHIKFMMELGDALREEAERMTARDRPTPYYVSSRFLHQCLEDLIEGSEGNEKLHFITGPEVGPFKALDQIIKFPMKYQTVASACGELRSTHEELIELDEWGHALHAIFHSHPGNGPGATRPSHTDKSTRERYERGGYLCVGGIFTREGHVRFFSVKHKFRICLYGKGVEEIEDNLYRLKRPESL